MRFRIVGTDAATNKPVELTLDAADEAAARAEASKRKVIAVRVEPAPDAASPARSPEPLLVRIEPGHVQLIERTAKRWKGLLLVSLLVLTFGAVIGGYFLLRSPRSLAHPPALAWIGGAAALIGLMGVVIARLGAWWHHG